MNKILLILYITPGIHIVYKQLTIQHIFDALWGDYERSFKILYLKGCEHSNKLRNTALKYHIFKEIERDIK